MGRHGSSRYAGPMVKPNLLPPELPAAPEQMVKTVTDRSPSAPEQSEQSHAATAPGWETAARCRDQDKTLVDVRTRERSLLTYS